MFHVLYHPEFLELSLSTLQHYYYGIRALARSCERQGFHDVGTFFSDDRASKLILDDLLDHPGSVGFLHIGAGLFNAFHRFGESAVGFQTCRGKTYNRLRTLLRELNRNSYQHPVIPWAIYKNLLLSISQQIEEGLARLNNPAWVEIIRFHNTENTREFRKFPSLTVKFIKREFPEFSERIGSMQALLGELGALQELARLGIMAYTGCRVGEVSTLTHAEPKEVEDSTFLIFGKTTKSMVGDVYWVTNQNGADAVRLALKVREIVIRGLGLDSDSDLPLLPSLVGFPNNVTSSKSRSFSCNNNYKKRHQTNMNGVLERVWISVPTIGQDDYDFLCELSRDCRIDLAKFSVGSEFPFTGHQLRRSLAYFVMRAGGVEIGAMKRQFKQLFVAMARYYTSGVVSTEVEPNMAMTELVAKERLLEIDERLHRHLTNHVELSGAMGTSIKSNIETAVDSSRDEVIEGTRERMLKRVKQGEINYIETPLGACLSKDPCLTRARAEVSACLTCKNAVLELPKLEKTYRLLKISEHPFVAAQAEHFSHYLMGSKSRPGELQGETDG
jgi:hypothetical protein